MGRDGGCGLRLGLWGAMGAVSPRFPPSRIVGQSRGGVGLRPFAHHQHQEGEEGDGRGDEADPAHAAEGRRQWGGWGEGWGGVPAPGGRTERHPPIASLQFLDDPGLKNDVRNKPVQLPLAHSGWLFQEEGAEQEEPQPHGPKEEKMELEPPAVKGTGGGGLGWGCHPAAQPHPACSILKIRGRWGGGVVTVWDHGTPGIERVWDSGTPAPSCRCGVALGGQRGGSLGLWGHPTPS